MVNCVAAAELPNVVMIMADDWGWSDIAAYRRFQGLDDPIPTPNLDRLCAEGMIFTDAHSPAALCAPTRFSMMTGSNPYRNTVQWGTWGLTATSAFSKNRRHITVGEIAQTAGYRTAFFGKMHFGGGTENFEEPMPNFPTTYGFDYVFSTHGGIQDDPYLYFENDRFAKINPADPLNPSELGWNSDLIEWPSGSYTITNGTGIINSPPHDGIGDVNWNSSQNGIINSRKAAGFIGEHLAHHPDQPFMVYYCMPQVHVPHSPPIDFEPDAYGIPGSPPNVPVAGATVGDNLADMVYEVDLQVGWILNKLEDPNGDGETSDSILADTLVMFTSDNGGLAADRGITGYDSTGVLRGSKAMMEEGGHRVPFVAMWNGMIAPGTVSDQLICGHDWVGVMYALSSQSMAADQAMDCANILPILLGEQDEAVPVRDFMIHQSQNSKAYPYAIRQGDYVLFVNLDRTVAGELYNLVTDLPQAVNLLAGTPAAEDLSRRDEMFALFLQHDQANDFRTTSAYTTPDVHAPFPNPAGFETVPSATGSSSVTMTATEGIDPSGPVEYFFSETSGHEGGSSSGWQTSAVYTDGSLLPELTYSYSVQMRDALGHVGHTSAVHAVTTGTNSVVLADDFENSVDSGNIGSAPYPVGVWHHQGTNSWQTEGNNSVLIGDFGTLAGNELRIGWGYDEVVTLYSLTSAIDTNRTYTFSGNWEIDNTLDVPRGFIAGIAEFSGADGSLVQRLTPDSLVFGNTNTPTSGETGTFSVAITPAELAAAGVSSGNRIGVLFHHDDGGTLYDDSNPLKNDVYLVDDVQLAIDIDSVFEQWSINYGVSGATADSDGDGIDNLVEFALGGNPTNPLSAGHLPTFGNFSNVFRYVYPRRINSGLDYSVEKSTNLLDGAWTTNGCVELSEVGLINVDFESVTNVVPSDEKEAFIRLRIKEK